MILLGIIVTLLVSWFLSKTMLRGVPSSFTLELPPYRIPQVGKVIIRSVFDRTLFVLGRAVMVAVPAGVVVWILANTSWGGLSILELIANFLQPLGRLIGLDGFILTAFLLGLPANEIVIPILIMSYLSEGSMIELDSLDSLRQLFVEQGWTWLTALNMMLFSVLHFPCSTTLITIKKETGSKKWTFMATLIPTTIALIVCFLVAQGSRLLGLV
jgi:ferrous iron transport protein B